MSSKIQFTPGNYTVTLQFTLDFVQSMNLDKCIMKCIHHYSIIWCSFTALKFLCAKPTHPFLRPTLSNYWSCFFFSFFTVSFFLSFPVGNIVEIIQYVSFQTDFHSYSNMNVSFLHACLVAHFFIVLKNTPLSVWITVYPFTYWWASWLLPGFDNYEKATTDIWVQVFVWMWCRACFHMFFAIQYLLWPLATF